MCKGLDIVMRLTSAAERAVRAADPHAKRGGAADDVRQLRAHIYASKATGRCFFAPLEIATT